MSYYFYILHCKDKKRYYGHTNNLMRRVLEHSKGKVKTTKNRRSIRLVYFEELQSRSQTFKREMQFKNGKTRKDKIDKLIRGFPIEKCQGFNSQTACAYDLCSPVGCHKSSAY
ncbi:MAG: GIY-YIG nuclease family protein [Candidatus Omnitrophota bacterium]|nr:GIY-YIG nuclease family protein [Candidatus Omnitrophota bacterium]